MSDDESISYVPLALGRPVEVEESAGWSPCEWRRQPADPMQTPRHQIIRPYREVFANVRPLESHGGVDTDLCMTAARSDAAFTITPLQHAPPSSVAGFTHDSDARAGDAGVSVSGSQRDATYFPDFRVVGLEGLDAARRVQAQAQAQGIPRPARSMAASSMSRAVPPHGPPAASRGRTESATAATQGPSTRKGSQSLAASGAANQKQSALQRLLKRSYSQTVAAVAPTVTTATNTSRAGRNRTPGTAATTVTAVTNIDAGPAVKRTRRGGAAMAADAASFATPSAVSSTTFGDFATPASSALGGARRGRQPERFFEDMGDAASAAGTGAAAGGAAVGRAAPTTLEDVSLDLRSVPEGWSPTTTRYRGEDDDDVDDFAARDASAGDGLTTPGNSIAAARKPSQPPRLGAHQNLLVDDADGGFAKEVVAAAEDAPSVSSRANTARGTKKRATRRALRASHSDSSDDESTGDSGSGSGRSAARAIAAAVTDDVSYVGGMSAGPPTPSTPSFTDAGSTAPGSATRPSKRSRGAAGGCGLLVDDTATTMTGAITNAYVDDASISTPSFGTTLGGQAHETAATPTITTPSFGEGGSQVGAALVGRRRRRSGGTDVSSFVDEDVEGTVVSMPPSVALSSPGSVSVSQAVSSDLLEGGAAATTAGTTTASLAGGTAASMKAGAVSTGAGRSVASMVAKSTASSYMPSPSLLGITPGGVGGGTPLDAQPSVGGPAAAAGDMPDPPPGLDDLNVAATQLVDDENQDAAATASVAAATNATTRGAKSARTGAKSGAKSVRSCMAATARSVVSSHMPSQALLGLSPEEDDMHVDDDGMSASCGGGAEGTMAGTPAGSVVTSRLRAPAVVPAETKRGGAMGAPPRAPLTPLAPQAVGNWGGAPQEPMSFRKAYQTPMATPAAREGAGRGRAGRGSAAPRSSRRGAAARTPAATPAAASVASYVPPTDPLLQLAFTPARSEAPLAGPTGAFRSTQEPFVSKSDAASWEEQKVAWEKGFNEYIKIIDEVEL